MSATGVSPSMAEGEVIAAIPESQDSQKSLTCADGNGNLSGCMYTESQKNIDPHESSLSPQDQEQIYGNVEGNPNVEGRLAGEETGDQPKRIKKDTLELSKDESDYHDGDSPKQSMTDNDSHDKPGKYVLMDADKGGADHQTTAEERDNVSGNAEGGNNESQEPSVRSDNTVIQDSQDEPMEVDAPGTEGETQNSSSKSDQTDTQDSQNDSGAQSEDSSGMEVDDATGQTSAVAKNGSKLAIKGTSDGSGTSVLGSSQKRMIEGMDDSLVETVGQLKDTAKGKTDGIAQDGGSIETGRKRKHTAERMDKGIGQIDKSVEATGEPESTTEEMNDGSGSSADAIERTTGGVNGFGQTNKSVEATGESKPTIEEMNDESGSSADAIEQMTGGVSDGTGSSTVKQTTGEVNVRTDISADAIIGKQTPGGATGSSADESKLRTGKDSDEDDLSDDDSSYGYRWGRSWASKDTEMYRSGYKVNQCL